MRDSGIEVTYCDLPLNSPAVDWAAEGLAAQGFVFAGPLALKYGGVDVLRYQCLGETEVDPSRIHLKSSLAETLLDCVFGQLDEAAVSRARA